MDKYIKLKEELIKNYFNAWKENNDSILDSTFENDIVYSECFGPEYHGIDQLKLWFTHWNKKGEVLSWDIHQFIHSSNKTVVEWYFKCNYDSEVSEFNGVSIIEFTSDLRIKSLKEFESKAEHIYPYGQQK